MRAERISNEDKFKEIMGAKYAPKADVFNFGMYEGISYTDILRDEPWYLYWLRYKVHDANLNSSIKKFLVDNSREITERGR